MISVLLPTWNGEAYLRETLESLREARPGEVEIVAIDDGSTDGTVALLRAFQDELPLRLLERPRTGNWVANTNEALRAARGDWVCLLHQDDLWCPGRPAALLAHAERSPASVCIVHPSWFIDSRGSRRGRWGCPLPAGMVPSAVVRERLLVQNFLAICAPLFRREVALRLGGLDEKLWYTADWEFWLRLAAEGPWSCEPRPLTCFRVHGESQTARRSSAADLFREQLESVLERQLAAAPVPAATRRAARFSIEVNVALAARLHGQRPAWRPFLRALRHLGPRAGWRYLRDSRIVERVAARVRARFGDRRWRS